MVGYGMRLAQPELIVRGSAVTDEDAQRAYELGQYMWWWGGGGRSVRCWIKDIETLELKVSIIHAMVGSMKNYNKRSSLSNIN